MGDPRILAIEALQDGWDGVDGKAPTPGSIELLKRYIRGIESNCHFTITVAADVDGFAVIELEALSGYRTSHKQIQIYFDPDEGEVIVASTDTADMAVHSFVVSASDPESETKLHQYIESLLNSCEESK